MLASMAQMLRYSDEFNELPEVVRVVLRQTRGAGGHGEEDVFVVPVMSSDASRCTRNVINPIYPNLGSVDLHDPSLDNLSGCDFDTK